ncbi:MAG: hypothetical protein ABFS46_18020 [Myxococcota bacterium]
MLKAVSGRDEGFQQQLDPRPLADGASRTRPPCPKVAGKGGRKKVGHEVDEAESTPGAAGATRDTHGVRAQLSRALGERRTSGGGFVAVPGGPADSESTALSALALHAMGDELGETVAWLQARQRADGAWPRTDAVREASWATAWAALALARLDAGSSEPVARAGAWLTRREGRRPGLLTRVIGHLTNLDERLEQDLMLVGWPWHEDAASWVEPTATAMLALHAIRERAALPAAAERLEQGERLLWDRVCVDGGWNYGNRRVLGEVLLPFPDTTAFALLALQGSPREPELARSFDALERLLDERASGLSLALAVLAHELHGRDAHPLRERVAEKVGQPEAARETRSIAFMALALSGGAELLRASR